ncbi:MAG: hypothetical protein OHK0046_14630 [Anaerolineae bacterium]
MTILLAVEDTTRRRKLQSTLVKTSHRIVIAENLSTVLKHVQREQPQLVILDMQETPATGTLGGVSRAARQDPFTLCEGIRQQPEGKTCIILGITAANRDDTSRALAAGADDCIITPDHPLLLLRRIDNLLRLHPMQGQESLQETEARYRRMFDSTNEAIIITEANTGVILDANIQAARWLGYSRDELLRMLYSEIEMPPENPMDMQVITRELATQGHFIFEQRYRSRDGRVIPVEVSSRIFNYAGHQAAIHAARDITQRLRLEAAEREQRLLAEALRDAAGALSSTLNEDEVIRRIISYVTRVVPAENVDVMLVDNGVLKRVERHGYEPTGIDESWLQNQIKIRDVNTLRWMSENLCPLVIPDVFDYPDWQTFDEPQWIRSYIGAPIVINAEVVGFLNLNHRTPNMFNTTHEQYVVAFANQASIAIQNARLHQAVQRHAEELEQRVTERTLELMRANLKLKEQIEERKRAETALNEERKLLRVLIDNIPDDIYVKDTEGKFILVNKPLEKRLMSHSNGKRVTGTFDAKYVSPHILEDMRSEERQIVETGEPLFNREEQVTLSDGSVREMLVTKVPLRDGKGKVVAIVGVHHDVTALRKADAELKRERNLLRTLIDNLPDEVYVKDVRGEIILANKALIRRVALAAPQLQVIGSTTLDYAPFVIAEDAAQRVQEEEETLMSAANGAEPINREVMVEGESGGKRWFLTTRVPLVDNIGQVQGMVGVNHDITDRKLAEETLQRANELLEQRVHERTLELSRSNDNLKQQIVERKRAEQAEREQRILAEALGAAAAALSQTLELTEVLDRILTYVARVVPPHESAGVLLIEDDIYVRMIRLREMTDDEVIPSASDKRIVLDSLPNLRYMQERALPVVVNDPDAAQGWKTMFNTSDLRSYVGVPIQAEGKVIGYISLGSKSTNQFTDDHGQRLLAFSNQAGIAIQNARLFEAVRLNTTDLRRRVAERTVQLEHERAQLHAILNAMTEGVIYYDHHGEVKYVNDSLTRLTGYTAEDWQGDNWTDLIVKDEEEAELTAIIRRDVSHQGIWNGDIRMRRRGGEVFDAKVVTTMVTGPDGRPTGSVAVLRDVSAEKRLESQKTRFIATASHELRTPITNLKTRLYLIRRQPEKAAEHMDVLEYVTNRMRKLVDDLLEISRFEHGIVPLDLTDVALHTLIEDVVRVQKPEAEFKSQSLIMTLPPEDYYIRADAARMAQVLTNLVTNAINYTPDGGTIEITAEAEAEHIKIYIKDTGVGIPEDLLPEVFKPFFRVNNQSKGTGLGLSITKEIVERHNGTIVVESSLGQGACFIITLPLLTPMTPPFIG